jgi:hypothetical protein
VSGERRRAVSTPGERREPGRRGPLGLIASLVIHAVMVALFVRIVIVPYDFLTPPGRKAVPLLVERIGFLALPRSPQAQRVQPRSGGDNRPPRAAAAPAPVVAPSAVPAAIPEVPRQAAPPRDTSGAGLVVGAGGAAQGIRPSFADPRIWAPNAPVVIAPMSPKQRIDSAIAARVRALEDSLAGLPAERAPGDWTFMRGGKKYGIDQKLIHLGDYSLPTAVLALLPLNAQGNPAAYERGRRLDMMRAEIQEQAARVARDEDFRAAVKALRERKLKEQQDQQKKKTGEPTPDKPVPGLP